MKVIASLIISALVLAQESYSQETRLSPVVHRFKRHCGGYGCGKSVCQECPECCSSPPQISPVFNIQFNCCSSRRPSPACCPYVAPSPPAPIPPPPISQPCCGVLPAPSPSCCPMPGPCCTPPPPPPPPPPAPSPVICCKQAPVPENPCCQVVAASIPPMPSSPPCCASAPVPSNPCCQPAPKLNQCTCSAPRPVPCRCGAPSISIDCPNCDMPPQRCSMMSPNECSMRRMRRDTHQQILWHVYKAI